MYFSANNPTTNMFCNPDMAMAMSMDGFRFSLLFGGNRMNIDMGVGMDDDDIIMDTAAPCLVFMLSSFTLDTPTKFIMAMIAVVVLGVLVEFIAALRSSGTLTKLFRSSNDNSGGGGARCECCGRLFRKLLVVSTHVVQAAIGYILMLAAMSYSVELFGSVLFGLGLGYCLFFEVGGGDIGMDGAEGAANPRTNTDSGGTGTGCCDLARPGPPRRAFRGLNGIVSGGEDNEDDSDSDGDTNPIPLHDGEDYLSLESDDKMTPLL